MISFGSPAGRARGSEVSVAMCLPLSRPPSDHNTKDCGGFRGGAMRRPQVETICLMERRCQIGNDSTPRNFQDLNCRNLSLPQPLGHDLVWCESRAQLGNTTRKPC